MAASPDPPYTKLQPVVGPGEWRPRDPTADLEAQQRLRGAWDAWDAACAQAPAARNFLEGLPALLEEAEAGLSAADAALEQARARFVLDGGAVLTNAAGESLVMTDEAEEDKDADVVFSKAARTRAIQRRARLWALAEQARGVLSVAEGQRPPGIRPRD